MKYKSLTLHYVRASDQICVISMKVMKMSLPTLSSCSC